MFYANQLQPGTEETEEEIGEETQVEETESEVLEQETSAAETSQPQASTSAAVTKGRSSAASSADASRKKRKSTEEEKCLEAVKDYFVQKTAKPSAAQSSTTNPATDDDDRFGLMLAAEMRHIKTTSVKRELKRKLWDLVLNAQAEDEQLQNLQVVTWFVDPATAVQQETPVVAAADQPGSSQQGSGGDAELLLHLHQSV